MFSIKNLLMLSIASFITFKVGYFAYLQADPFVDDWTKLPGFNMLNHPHPDFWRSFEEIVRNENMTVESHEVITEDGYINQMYRINNFKDGADKTKKREAVLLVHGMLDSSDAWIINGRNNSVAFNLADRGYDVWLPNCRGNDYSLGHQTLDSKTDAEYWNNAYMVPIMKYDLPAFITYAEKVSNANKVLYMGHSQGAQAALILYGTNVTWFNEHVYHVVAMGAYLVVDSVTGRMNHYQMNIYQALSPYVEKYNIFQMRPWFIDEILIGYGCAYNKPACDWVNSYISIRVPPEEIEAVQVDSEREKIYFGHYPKGSSIRCWHHIYQQQKDHYLSDFDWGVEKNQILYGDEDPPEIKYSFKGGKPKIHVIQGKFDGIISWDLSHRTHLAIGDEHLAAYIDIPGGHNAFFVSKASGWFDKAVMEAIMEIHPIEGWKKPAVLPF